ncbi:MAG: MFS transporter [Burkholderiales bacterium]|nr:MFS transporter [Burkholderiales bacterium]
MISAAASPARDTWVISLVGLMHGASHFYQLALPAVFLSVRDEWGVSFAQLGLLTALFYTVSGLCQTPAGFAVDRFGASRVLLFGMAMFALGIGLMGFAPNFEWMIGCALIAAVGNSVFHPADFGVLNSTLEPRRLGPAYGIHGVSGNIGWAVCPATMVALQSWFGGWRGALIAAGVLGLLILALAWSRRAMFEPREVSAGARKAAGGTAALTSLPILMCFSFFLVWAAGLIGLQTFGMPALTETFDLPVHLAALTLTCFLIGGGVGMLAGGMLAARAVRHDHVAALGIAAAVACVIAIAGGRLGPTGIIIAITAAGVLSGLTGPSRDMIVRSATSKGNTGKVYGFVYSGLDAGSAIVPLLFGWLLDHGRGTAMIYCIAFLWAISIIAIYAVRQSNPAPASG